MLIFLQMEADISFFPKYIPSTVFNDQQSTASSYSRACSRACHAVILCKKCVSTWEDANDQAQHFELRRKLFLCKPHCCSEGHQPKRMVPMCGSCVRFCGLPPAWPSPGRIGSPGRLIQPCGGGRAHISPCPHRSSHLQNMVVLAIAFSVL